MHRSYMQEQGQLEWRHRQEQTSQEQRQSQELKEEEGRQLQEREELEKRHHQERDWLERNNRGDWREYLCICEPHWRIYGAFGGPPKDPKWPVCPSPKVG